MRFSRWFAAVTVTVAACSGSNGDRADPIGAGSASGILFLSQASRPSAVMDALFEGRVVTDAAGCVRLDGPDPATVVWPHGFTLDDDLVVRAADNRRLGRIIGDRFRLGGGEVPTIANSVAAPVRQLAETRCPGPFWIVGDVLP